MTEEKLVERVTALFADSDVAQRKMIRLYAETNDAIEASAIIDSGAEVLHMLQGGLRPEVLVLDSVLSDTTIFPLLRSIRQQQIEYEPHIIVTLMPSAAPQIEKILTLGAECTIFKPYSLPELFDTVYQTAASGPRLNRYLVHESVTAQLRTLGCYKNLAYGINYLQEAVYIAVCDRQACSLGELCTKAGEPFGVNGPAVRSALERLNARLYKSNTPAYQMLCERNGKTPQDRLTVSELLEAVKQRIFRLERLADNAADLVAQSQPPRQLNWTVQEMTVYLAQLCDAANHELEECAVTGRVHLQPMPQNQPVWAQIDLAIVQTMFANLFSNSLRANPAAKITISCTGRTLEYHDGRIWPEAACAQLAGVQTPEALANGCTGLLLVYRCAQNLGWRLETAANQETVLRMTLPPEPLAAFGTHNVLRTPRPESGAARLREEFRATLPPKKI